MLVKGDARLLRGDRPGARIARDAGCCYPSNVIRAWAPTLLLAFLAALPGCREKPPTGPEVGKRLFSYEYRQVRSFEVLRDDPDEGRWNARLEKKDGKWIIASAPGVDSLVDRLGNTNFINHLLDAIAALRVSEVPEKGPLRSFGLERPRWIFRWNAGAGTMELKVGDQSGVSFGRFVLKGQTDDATVIVSHGAAFGLVTKVTGFQSIRQPWVATWTVDDVFEVLVKRGEKRVFGAERRAGVWVDPKERELKGMDDWLARMIHFRILRYIDSSDSRDLFKKISSDHQALRAIFKDRHGKERWLAFKKAGDKAFAVTGERPGAAFEVSSNDAGLFSPPSATR